MPNIIEMTGKVCGNFTVINLEYIKNGRSYWLCQCNCGAYKILDQAFIARRKLNQCYCYKKICVQGTKEYSAWCHMKRRCYNPKDSRYYSHGARGIKVCDQWLNSYKTFLSDIGHAPSRKHSLDRINNDGNYEPSNCRWTTAIEQMNNTTKNLWVEYNGQKKTLAIWCTELKLKYHKVYNRLTHNWDVHKAFLTP